jgi:hypothetical protein
MEIGRDGGHVNKKKDKSADDLSLALVVSDLNLARAFAAVARSAYSVERLAEGESAREKTIRFYCQALRSVLQMAEPDRKSFSLDLQNLRTQIEWLSVQRGRPANSPRESQEDTAMENLWKLLEEKG